jgi:signal transduction histidine kinase
MQETLAQANLELTRTNAALADSNRRLAERSKCFEALENLSQELGGDPHIEQVVKAAVGAGGKLLPKSPLACFIQSTNRGITLIASQGPDLDDVRVEVLPVCDLFRSESQDIRVVGMSKWFGVEELGEDLRDQLTALVGRPPTCFFPIQHQGVVLGGLSSTQSPPKGGNSAFGVLASWIGLWVHTAEARAMAERLNEDLADVNCRLVSSQAEIARMRSLAMVGEMAAGAAHEINGPLAVISGRAQLITRDVTDEGTGRCAHVIAEQAHRASAIVTELMEFAKPTPPKAEDFSLRTLLEELRQQWIDNGSLSEREFALDISDEIPLVHADVSQTRMLFDEIINNAVDATRQTSNRKLVINCAAELADEKVVIRFVDNGHGMTPDVLERACDPFFSHQPAGRRRGLGLSRAARYAEINHGGIRLSSRVNEGTIVFVELPASVTH